MAYSSQDLAKTDFYLFLDHFDGAEFSFYFSIMLMARITVYFEGGEMMRVQGCQGIIISWLQRLSSKSESFKTQSRFKIDEVTSLMGSSSNFFTLPHSLFWQLLMEMLFLGLCVRGNGHRPEFTDPKWIFPSLWILICLMGFYVPVALLWRVSLQLQTGQARWSWTALSCLFNER